MAAVLIFSSMPYTIRKSKCKQKDGDVGGWTLSYTDKRGKKHTICHTSKQKAKGQIAAIEIREDVRELVRLILEASE